MSAAASAAEDRPPTIAFTICSRNFLAQAQLLHESLTHFHPEVTFYAVICDEISNADVDSLSFDIVSLHDLGLPQLEKMVAQYNITELNTSVKPFAFQWIFAAHPGAAVLYFDPDIWVLSRLVELEAALRDGAECVLTPHLTEPAEYAEMHDGNMLQFGIYNLGFCALRDTETVRRVVSWWGRRLETQCVIDLAAGLFVDQKWADLLPAFIERTTILRHPGYNVAYWNLSQRTVTRVMPDKLPEWRVNGEPLRFFHFSGSVVDEPRTFTRHSFQFRTEALRNLTNLFDAYCRAVYRLGRAEYRVIPYAFSWNGARQQNLHTPQTLGASGAAGPWSIAEGKIPHLPVQRIRSFEEMTRTTRATARQIRRRREFEAELIPADLTATFNMHGDCVVCGQRQLMQASFMYAAGTLPDGRLIPNWREHLDCLNCGFVNRLRATLHVMAQEARPALDARIYITEQVTPLYKWIQSRFPNTVGSEYLGAGRTPGEVVNGIRNEDIQRLSFGDGAFDTIISLEVLEHVPDYRAAVAELARCLRPGGKLLLTAPFRENRYDHETRAVLEPDGSILHLLEPEYHGNPVDPEGGALCFRYYGWQLFDELREMGFSEAEMLFYWSDRYKYLGNTNAILLATK